MTSRDFCFWLQGFFEISGKKELTPDQIKMIDQHLQYVFTTGDLAFQPPAKPVTVTAPSVPLFPKQTLTQDIWKTKSPLERFIELQKQGKLSDFDPGTVTC